MKEIKSIFDSVNIPEVSSGFEDRIIAAATKPAPRQVPFYANYAVAACLVFLVAAFGLYSHSSTVAATDYASIIDVIDEDDVYNDLI